MMRRSVVIATAVCLAFLAGPVAGQTSKPPISTPGVVAPPTWWRTIPMADGRTFVTDGGISIDAALVKPEKLPESVPGSAPFVARQLSAPHDKEIALGDLVKGPFPNTFATPDGVVLNGNYITLLRKVAAAPSMRLRTKGKTDPVVVVVNGQAVAVMAVVQPPRDPKQ